MNPFTAILVASTLKPIVDVLTWCLLVGPEELQVSPLCSDHEGLAL